MLEIGDVERNLFKTKYSLMHDHNTSIVFEPDGSTSEMLGMTSLSRLNFNEWHDCKKNIFWKFLF